MKLRKLTKEDLPLRVKWMNSPEVYRSMHFEIPVLLENTERWFSKISSDQTRVDVAFSEKDQVVAMGGLTHIDPVTLKAELYIFVNPENQSSGLGTQAVRLLCNYGFEELHLNKIYLITNEDNIPAQKVYGKCGFTLEGRLRHECVDIEGVLKDRFYYGLLKEEWDEERFRQIPVSR